MLPNYSIPTDKILHCDLTDTTMLRSTTSPIYPGPLLCNPTSLSCSRLELSLNTWTTAKTLADAPVNHVQPRYLMPRCYPPIPRLSKIPLVAHHFALTGMPSNISPTMPRTTNHKITFSYILRTCNVAGAQVTQYGTEREVRDAVQAAIDTVMPGLIISDGEVKAKFLTLPVATLPPNNNILDVSVWSISFECEPRLADEYSLRALTHPLGLPADKLIRCCAVDQTPDSPDKKLVDWLGIPIGIITLAPICSISPLHTEYFPTTPTPPHSKLVEILPPFFMTYAVEALAHAEKHSDITQDDLGSRFKEENPDYNGTPSQEVLEAWLTSCLLTHPCLACIEVVEVQAVSSEAYHIPALVRYIMAAQSQSDALIGAGQVTLTCSLGILRLTSQQFLQNHLATAIRISKCPIPLSGLHADTIIKQISTMVMTSNLKAPGLRLSTYDEKVINTHELPVNDPTRIEAVLTLFTDQCGHPLLK
jgi:hypothetical protein